MDEAAFEVRPSRIHGHGVYARVRVSARRKLGELGGERITLREARRRARLHDSIKIVEFDDGTALDATHNDGAFSYVNHSCAPNAYLRRAYGRVEFYALRDIAPGEELTCDYGETHHDGKLPCQCGSERCRGKI